jgi:hypothetical protein
MMPRDVRTRWNATYDMLEFAYEYKDAINQITDRRDMKLRDYEIEPHEWDVVKQLRDVLGVRPSIIGVFFLTYHTSITGFQGCNALFFPRWHSKRCVRHTCHGPSGRTPGIDRYESQIWQTNQSCRFAREKNP